jgi:hypothetical protein
MTDIEKLRGLLSDFGVEFEERDEDFYRYVTCTEGGHKVDGYSMFYTEFQFDKDTGRFIGMGAWE